MLYGWFTRIMNRPKKVNAVALICDQIVICIFHGLWYTILYMYKTKRYRAAERKIAVQYKMEVSDEEKNKMCCVCHCTA